jgi:hypothetical protein
VRRLLRFRRARIRAAGAGLLAAALAVPAGAGASAVHLARTHGSNGRGEDITKTITYRADPGEANALDLTLVGSTPSAVGAVRRYRLSDPCATGRGRGVAPRPPMP